MKTITELETLFRLLAHITECYAAEADAQLFLKKRRVEVTVDQGGKTIYAATLEIDSPALEAKARLVRFELEQMIAECSLPILHMEAAA